jgi:DNA-binding NarL/FixJ family response regulator
MIKLTVITSNEEYLKQLTNRLYGEKDISLLSTIIIQNHASEQKEILNFIEQVTRQKPDILLFDQRLLRDAAALDLEKILDYKNNLPEMKIIIVGIRFNEENVMAMMQGGIRGFFRLELGEEKLINCIRTVSRGEIWLDANLITSVFDEFIKEFMKQKDLIKPLTDLSLDKLKMLSPREMEVMELISHSLTNEEIADKLFLSPKTVKTHIRNIFAKAEIRNRVEAALLYARHTLDGQ